MNMKNDSGLRGSALAGGAPDIERHARPEVKCTLALGDVLWVGTQHGLCRRLPGGHLEPLETLPAEEVRGLGPMPGGMVAAIGRRIARLDGQGGVLGWIDGPAGEKTSCVTAATGRLIAGSKTGIFAHGADGWTRLHGGDGVEVIKLFETQGRLLASVKKQGAKRLPALLESLDGGATWQMEEMGDYGDIVLAADARVIVTRWRGARPRGVVPHGYKKHPLTGAAILPDGGVIVLDGDKVEIAGPGRRKAEVFHPRAADGEHVHLLPEGIFIAGAQGAFVFDPVAWRIRDVSTGLFAGRQLGKRKRVFALDGTNLAAFCTFGTFHSADGGRSWQPSDAEWDVLDAERVARAPDGTWYLLCQRGLFRSPDQGARWDYVKPKLPKGVRHYGEFRSLAIAGGRLWMGTKQGLFTASLEAPEHLAPLAGIEAPVEALLAEPAGTVLAAVDGVGLLRVGGERPEPVSDVALHEAVLLQDGARVLMADEGGLRAVAADGSVTPAVSGKAAAAHNLATDGARLIAWHKGGAWLRASPGAEWLDVPGWPADIRSVALLPDGRAVLTDRAQVSAFDLPHAT